MLPAQRKDLERHFLNQPNLIVAMVLGTPIGLVIVMWKYGFPVAWSSLSSLINNSVLSWEQQAWTWALLVSIFNVLCSIIERIFDKDRCAFGSLPGDPMRCLRAPAWLHFGKPLMAIAAVGLIDNGWWAWAALIIVWIVGFAVTEFACPMVGEFGEQLDRLKSAAKQKGYVCPGCFADLPEAEAAGECRGCGRPFTAQGLLVEWRFVKPE